MRALWLVLALVATSAPAAALGLTQASVTADVDAPLLAPVQVNSHDFTPAAILAPILAAPPEEAPAAILATEAPDLVDGEIDDELLVQPHVTFSPPQVITGFSHMGKLARLDRAEAALGVRVASPALRALDVAPLVTGTLDQGAATHTAPLLAPRASQAPSTGSHAAATTTVAPPAAPGGDITWPAVAAGVLLLVIAPLVLYHRLRGQAIANEGARRDLLELITARPGMSASEIARAMQVDPSTAVYHVRRLMSERMVVAEGSPRSQRYFAAGAQAPEARSRLLAEARSGDVLTVIRQEPGLTKTKLAESLAISRATVTWHLSTLETAGLVRLERQGQRVHVFPISF